MSNVFSRAMTAVRAWPRGLRDTAPSVPRPGPGAPQRPPEATSLPAHAYRLFHISDVHFGATFDRSLWEYICALIKRERPNLVVCTGDIVDHGGLFMLALAKRQFDSLPDETGVPHRFRCVAGNHDYGLWGNIRVRPFSTNFVAIFGPHALATWAWLPTYLRYKDAVWIKRLLVRTVATVGLYLFKWTAAALALLGLREKFGHQAITRDDDRQELPEVSLIYLDSNDSMRLASGSVNVEELTRLKAKVLNMRDEDARSFVPRIALMHHHPLPIPDAKITEGLTSFEPFLVLRNAGIVLKELNRSDVDLILHGHKHYSTFSRLGYSIEHSLEGEIAVLAAGSAGVTHSESGRNSVNFVDVFPNGRLTYTSIYFGGGAGAPVTELFSATQYVHEIEMHKRRVHRRGVERHGQWLARVTHEVAVDSRGSAGVTHQASGHTFVRDQRTTRLNQYWSVSMGRILEDSLEFIEESRKRGHAWSTYPQGARQAIQCEIDLGQPLAPASPPVDYGYKFLCSSTYAITSSESDWAYEADRRAGIDRGRRPGLEFSGIIVRAPVRELVLRVGLPMEGPEPAARVMRWAAYPNLPLDANRQFDGGDASGWVYDADMTAHESRGLARINEGLWELRVPFPLVGHRYDITWRVRDPAIWSEQPAVESARRGAAEAFRDLLLHLEEHPAERAAALAWISKLQKVAGAMYRTAVKGVQDVEVAVFVYDSDRPRLRQVLQKGPESEAEVVTGRFDMPLNEGVVGAALKRRATVIYVDPELSGVRENAAYLYQPDAGDTSSPPPPPDMEGRRRLPPLRPHRPVDGTVRGHRQRLLAEFDHRRAHPGIGIAGQRPDRTGPAKPGRRTAAGRYQGAGGAGARPRTSRIVRRPPGLDLACRHRARAQVQRRAPVDAGPLAAGRPSSGWKSHGSGPR